MSAMHSVQKLNVGYKNNSSLHGWQLRCDVTNRKAATAAGGTRSNGEDGDNSREQLYHQDNDPSVTHVNMEEMKPQHQDNDVTYADIVNPDDKPEIDDVNRKPLNVIYSELTPL